MPPGSIFGISSHLNLAYRRCRHYLCEGSLANRNYRSTVPLAGAIFETNEREPGAAWIPAWLAGVELLHRIRKGQFALSRLQLKDQTAPAIWNAVPAA